MISSAGEPDAKSIAVRHGSINTLEELRAVGHLWGPPGTRHTGGRGMSGDLRGRGPGPGGGRVEGRVEGQADKVRTTCHCPPSLEGSGDQPQRGGSVDVPSPPWTLIPSAATVS